MCRLATPAFSSNFAISMLSSTVLNSAFSPMSWSDSLMASMSTWMGKSSPTSSCTASMTRLMKRTRFSKVWEPYSSSRWLRDFEKNHWVWLLPAQFSSQASKPQALNFLAAAT